MLILSLIGFLVIREALNQAYEGGTGHGNTKRFISEQGLAHRQDGRKCV